MEKNNSTLIIGPCFKSSNEIEVYPGSVRARSRTPPSPDSRGKETTPRRESSARIVPLSAEYKSLVAELARHLWSPDPRLNALYLDWKYHQNPYVRNPLLYLAFVGDKLVGMRGAFGSRWEVGSSAETFCLLYVDDLVIDPAYRGQGLHRVIMNVALRDLAGRGYRYVINLSASRVTANASMNMHWRNAGPVGALYRRTLRKTVVDFLFGCARRLPLVWRWADNVSALSGRSGDHLFDRLDARFSETDRGRDDESLFVRLDGRARGAAAVCHGDLLKPRIDPGGQ